MRRFFVIICVLLVICFLLSACSSSEEPFLMDSRERNFLKSEFDENYSHYEDKLNIDKKAKTISVSGNVTSGIIELKIIEKDKDGNSIQTYEFTITDTLNETIELKKNCSNNWVVLSDFDENTEGGFKVEVFG